jgi:hypothetical protein
MWPLGLTRAALRINALQFAADRYEESAAEMRKATQPRSAQHKHDAEIVSRSNEAIQKSCSSLPS